MSKQTENEITNSVDGDETTTDTWTCPDCGHSNEIRDDCLRCGHTRSDGSRARDGSETVDDLIDVRGCLFLSLVIAGAIIPLILTIWSKSFFGWDASDVLASAFLGAFGGAIVAGMIVGIVSLISQLAGKGSRGKGDAFEAPVQPWRLRKKSVIRVTVALVLAIAIQIGVVMVASIVGESRVFEPAREVTFVVTGEGEALIEFSSPSDDYTEVVTLPWRTTISTKGTATVRAYSESDEANLQCSVEEDGRQVGKGHGVSPEREGYPSSIGCWYLY